MSTLKKQLKFKEKQLRRAQELSKLNRPKKDRPYKAQALTAPGEAGQFTTQAMRPKTTP